MVAVTEYRLLQVKLRKSARDLYLVKAPKNTKTKEKVFVKTKAINLKK